MLSASGCGVPDSVSGSGDFVSGSGQGDFVSGPVSGCVSGPGCIQTHSEDLHHHLHQLPAHLCGASGSRGASSGPGHRRDTSATANSGACRDAA